MEIGRHDLCAEGLQRGVERVGALRPFNVPALVGTASALCTPPASELEMRTHFDLAVQLSPLQLDALRHLCGELRTQPQPSATLQDNASTPTLTCSRTASVIHLTFASRARTSMAVCADAFERELARVQRSSPCWSAFLDCSTSDTMCGCPA